MASLDAHPRWQRLEAAARRLTGVRFRPQGRDAGGPGCAGLDCVGLVVAVAREAAVPLPAVAAFPLRGTGAGAAAALLRAAGCRRVAVEAAAPGDLMLQEPAALQVHLAIMSRLGVVEAHAGLRRVVERPLAAGERWHSAWRLPEGED